MFEGNTAFMKITKLLALKLLSNFIYVLFVCLNPTYTLIIVEIVEIKSDINIIEFWLAPAHIIIIGPSATLGKLFNIVRYGSNTCDENGLNHKNAATTIPINEPNKKLISISFNVTKICIIRSFDFSKLKIVLTTFLGLEHKNELIIPLSDSNCHIIKYLKKHNF